MFTHNGKPYKRRAYHPVKKQMVDWAGSDGENCGVFGLEMRSEDGSFAAMCPAEDSKKIFCCYMDPAVTPLFYMFHYHWNELSEVTKTCDSSAIKGHLEFIGAVYATSRTSLTERTSRLTSIKMRLNQIIDEFAQGSFFSPKEPATSAEYIKTVDCSVALYEALQRYTACQPGAAVDSSPFCSSYGMLSPYQSGLYYFLDYTMYEVPFAWWHKCMLMQGRTFARELSSSRSSTGYIQCDAWSTSSIREEMLNVTTYAGDSSSAWETLKNIEGGITSAMLQESIKQYKIRLQMIVRMYMKTGTPCQFFLHPLCISSQSCTLIAESSSRAFYATPIFRK